MAKNKQVFGAIFGVKVADGGVWFWASTVRDGRVTGMDVNQVFAQRMTLAQAESVAKSMDDETGAFWYVEQVTRGR